MRCEQGRPNRSRHDAVEKRKQTLLQEYLRKDKTGKFKDKRLMDETGGVMARKVKIFDLKMKNVDQSSLTHQGQRMDTGTGFADRPDADDFDEDMDLNLLRREDYVSSVHFGGGSDVTEHKKSQSEFLDEVKDEKKRRQLDQEKNWNLTEKLDNEWKDVRTLLTSNSSNQSREETKRSDIHDEESALNKDYDIVLREMIFASKSAKSKVGGKGSAEGAVGLDESKGASKSSKQSEPEQKVDERRQAIERIKRNDMVILPLLEPRIESLNAKKGDPLLKLNKKVKREFKSAQRELRKDTAFLKEVWMKEMKERDEMRKKKVNKIIADLASDIHEVRSLKKSS